MKHRKRYLGIDYGRKHVGLALATTPLAEPLETVTMDLAESVIQRMIAEYSITDLVFGASEGSMLQETIQFAERISALCHLPIHFQDETLSSHETRVLMAQAGFSKKKREQKIDHHVAAYILQAYIDAL